MLFVGGLEELLSLRKLSQILGLTIFICAVWQIALLVVGVGPVVRRAVEVVEHSIKLKALLLRHHFNLFSPH